MSCDSTEHFVFRLCSFLFDKIEGTMRLRFGFKKCIYIFIYLFEINFLQKWSSIIIKQGPHSNEIIIQTPI